jgi:general secretion pathway protein G
MKKLLKNLLKKIKSIFQSEDGFTMIELLIVVAIIAVLTGMAASYFSGTLDKAKVTAVEQDFNTFDTVLDAYRLSNGDYPSTEEGLQKVMDAGLLKKTKKALLDPWNNPYHYRYPGENNSDTPEIWSDGADKKPGGEGNKKDIKNWVSNSNN